MQIRSLMRNYGPGLVVRSLHEFDDHLKNGTLLFVKNWNKTVHPIILANMQFRIVKRFITNKQITIAKRTTGKGGTLMALLKTIWQIDLDRFGGESIVKSGEILSIKESADLIIKKYREQKNKPVIHVIGIGAGRALFDYLTDKKIPCTLIEGLLKRIGNADILCMKKEGDANNNN